MVATLKLLVMKNGECFFFGGGNQYLNGRLYFVYRNTLNSALFTNYVSGKKRDEKWLSILSVETQGDISILIVYKYVSNMSRLCVVSKAN